MSRIDRRSFVLSTAAAGAAFGLSGPVEIMPSAWAQTAPPSGPPAGPHPLNPKGMAFHKFKVGDIQVTTVFDGEVYRAHDAGFFKNVSVDETKAALKAAGMPDDRIPNTYTITFVTLGGRTVMFDSGGGGQVPGTGRLAESAKAAGIDIAKLSAIVVTHFHPDHIFGLLTKENGQVYENTEIVVPEAEYKFWSDPATIDKLPEAAKGLARRVQSTMATWKNIKQVAADKDAVAGVRAVATPGHTAGHTSYLVSAGGGQLLVLGDVTNIPAFNVRNPGWHIMFDANPQLAEANRRAIFDRAIADKMVCTGYHWGMPGAGTLAKDGNGYVLTPVA